MGLEEVASRFPGALRTRKQGQGRFRWAVTDESLCWKWQLEAGRAQRVWLQSTTHSHPGLAQGRPFGFGGSPPDPDLNAVLELWGFRNWSGGTGGRLYSSIFISGEGKVEFFHALPLPAQVWHVTVPRSAGDTSDTHPGFLTCHLSGIPGICHYALAIFRDAAHREDWGKMGCVLPSK